MLRAVKTLLIHAAWLLVATTAYFAGRKADREQPPPLVFAPAASPEKQSAEFAAEAHEKVTLPQREARAAVTSEVATNRTEAALSEPNTFARRQKTFAVLAQMTPENWEAIFQAFLAQTISQGRTHDFEWGSMLVRIGEVDGPHAIERFMKSHGAQPYAQEIASCLAGWAAMDGAAARAWLERQPDGPRKQALAGSLISGLTQSDPAAAMAFIGTLPPEERGNFARTLVEGTIQNGGIRAAQEMFEKARATSLVGGDDPLTATIFAAISDRVFHSNWIAKTPEQACRWVTDNAGRAYVTPEIVAHAAGDYAILDPAAAIYWVERNAAQFGAPQTEAALESVVGRWTANGFDGIAQWVETHEGEPSRDQVTAAFVRTLASRDPEAARQWSATITDPAARAKADAALQKAAGRAGKPEVRPVPSGE